MRKYTVLMVIVAFVCCFSIVPAATAASDEEAILEVQTNFMKAYTTRDLNLMLSLYLHSSKTSTFHPGEQPLLFEGWDESIEDRWRTVIASQTANITMSFHHPRVTMIKDDIAVINGYEDILATDPTTREQTILHYRVTRVVQKVRGKWLIVHDHVSQFSIE